MSESDLVRLPETDHLDIGNTMHDFTRPLVSATHFEDVSLSDLTASTPVLLVCYPMDGAILCPYFWNRIRDRNWSSIDSVTVVGVSISSPYEHRTFIEERGIDVKLFSDPAAGLAREFGIEHELDGMTGVVEHRPAVFLVDSSHEVQYAWVCEDWPSFPPYDEIEAAIEAL